MKILLDTSFLITAAENKVDLYEELKGNQLYTIDRVITELEKLKKGKLALSILKAKKIPIIKTGSKKLADDVLVEKKSYAIATQDVELKKRLKGRKIYTIRQKKYIKCFTK
tara:strand:- start:415 stop:747 length:333 start_codon:yes stop_codon:yes gene_type:complete